MDYAGSIPVLSAMLKYNSNRSNGYWQVAQSKLGYAPLYFFEYTPVTQILGFDFGVVSVSETYKCRCPQNWIAV